MNTNQTQDGLHVVTSIKSVKSRLSVGVEDVVTSLVYDGSTVIAEFTGATAQRRAEECLELARAQKARGVPITQKGKCVADGARVTARDVGPMLPWGGISSRA